MRNSYKPIHYVWKVGERVRVRKSVVAAFAYFQKQCWHPFFLCPHTFIKWVTAICAGLIRRCRCCYSSLIAMPFLTLLKEQEREMDGEGSKSKSIYCTVNSLCWCPVEVRFTQNAFWRRMKWISSILFLFIAFYHNLKSAINFWFVCTVCLHWKFGGYSEGGI